MKTPEFILELTEIVRKPIDAIRNLACFAHETNNRITELEAQLEAATRIILCVAAKAQIVDADTAVQALANEQDPIHLTARAHAGPQDGLVLEIKVIQGQPEREEKDEEEEPEPPPQPLRRKVPYQAVGIPKE